VVAPRRLLCGCRMGGLGFAKHPVDRREKVRLPCLVDKARLFEVGCSSRGHQLAGVIWWNLAEDNHRNPLGSRVSLELVQHLFSADSRQEQIQEDQVRNAFPSQTKGFFAVLGKEHEVTCPVEDPLAGQFLQFAVFHQKNCLFHARVKRAAGQGPLCKDIGSP
jgi:hypothetical protein